MKPKIMIFIASILGELVGALFVAATRPGYDYFVWLGLFAIIGIGAGNLVLLVLYEILKGVEAEQKEEI